MYYTQLIVVNKQYMYHNYILFKIITC